MSNTTIKCLMIGQSGVGKSAFLKHFPHATHTTNPSTQSESFFLETLSSKFEKVHLEIDSCNISLETCLHDADLLITTNNSKFINTSKYNVIILAFGLNDPNSFELVKSKWQVDLKKNKQNKHSFILLGLKPSENNNPKLKRTLSENSLLRLASKKEKKINKKKYQLNKASSDCEEDDFENEFCNHEDDHHSFGIGSQAKSLSLDHYKKFAKLISSSSQNFIQIDSVSKTTEPVESSYFALDINAYDRFLQSLLKASENSTEVKTKINVSKLKRSLTAPLTRPLNLLANRSKSRKIDESHKENLTSLSTNNKNEMIKSESAYTIRSKLSRFVINVGTYIVTCGTNKSRRLKNMKKLNEVTNEDVELELSVVENSSSSSSKPTKKNALTKKFVKKNKSWKLLSSSQMSLNSLEDSVFDE